jgi:transposase
VVGEAVAEGNWEDIGTLVRTPASAKRPSTVYRSAEKTVTLYGRHYRAIVIHSSAHDKRRLKRLDRQIRASEKTLHKTLAEQTRHEYFCRADADAAAARLKQHGADLHRIEVSVGEKVRYAPGRPPKDRPRKIASIRYVLDARVAQRPEEIQRKRDESGCFVLLTNVPRHDERAQTAQQLLRAYKDQYGIERNFSFLKDPLIVNDLFLKKPDRIEVLGAVLLISLLVWNLIEHMLRHHLVGNHTLIPGWDNKPTDRPTAFMMSTKFAGLQIIKVGAQRHLAKTLTSVQKRYLTALGLTERSLLSLYAAPG